MKTGVQMFFTVLLVAGGLLAYHLLVAQPAHAPDPAGEALDAEADPSDDPNEITVGPSGDTAPGLAGEGDEMLARANATRLAKIERALQVLQALQLSSGEPGGPRPDPLAPLDPKDLIDADKPAFDPETLETLTAYVDEINRRRARAKQVHRIETTLTGLGLDLPDAKRKAVADISLRMQARAVEELGREDLLPDERRRRITDLRREYAAALGRHIHPEEVDQILGSRVARRMGLTPPRKKDPRDRND